MTVEEILAQQNREFDAVNKLAEAWRGIQLTPIVDDDYPEVRNRYEGAVQEVLKAMRGNDRALALTMPVVTPSSDPILEIVLGMVREELKGATQNWPPFNSAHEGYAVLLEEVHELWEHVMQKQSKRDLAAMRDEAIDVAAMAVRFALDVCNEGRGRK